MLRLTRKPGEIIKLEVRDLSDDGTSRQLSVEISVVICGVRGQQVDLGIEAPRDKVKILRGELAEGGCG